MQSQQGCARSVTGWTFQHKMVPKDSASEINSVHGSDQSSFRCVLQPSATCVAVSSFPLHPAFSDEQSTSSNISSCSQTSSLNVQAEKGAG